MNQGSYDPSQPLKLYFRCARNGTLDFVFVDSSGNPYSLIYEDVEFHVYKNEGDKKPVFSLTPGDGISFPSTGRIRTTVTIAKTNINEGQYYFELYRPDLGKTWVADYAIFHNGRFDGIQESSETVIVSDEGNEVTITVDSVDTLVTRVNSITSASTVTPNADYYDFIKITAQAEALTLANPSGTPTEGQAMVIRIKDNGTARAISYGSEYRAIGVTLPTTTVISKTMYLAMVRNATDSKWDVIGVSQEA